MLFLPYNTVKSRAYLLDNGLSIQDVATMINQDYDKNRQIILENLGMRFIRFRDIDVKQRMGWVLEELMIGVEENKDSFNS